MLRNRVDGILKERQSDKEKERAFEGHRERERGKKKI